MLQKERKILEILADVPEVDEEVSCRGTSAPVADGAIKATSRKNFCEQCIGYVQGTGKGDRTTGNDCS